MDQKLLPDEQIIVTLKSIRNGLNNPVDFAKFYDMTLKEANSVIDFLHREELIYFSSKSGRLEICLQEKGELKLK